MSKRNICVDITKGLAIILMVLGHSSLPDSLSNFIYAFHMPVFFILSGYCTNWHAGTFFSFISRRTKALLIPFFAYSVIVWIMLKIIDVPVFSLAKGWGGLALWFVPVMFSASIIARAYFIVSNSIIKFLCLLICLITGVYLSYANIYLPWSASTIPYATILIIIGAYLKRVESKIFNSNILIPISATIIVFGISYFYRLDMAWNRILPIGILTFNAVLGSLMLMNYSFIFEKKLHTVSNLLVVTGRETYIILAFSQVIIMGINKYLMISSIEKYALLVGILILLVYLKRKLNDCLAKI